MKLLFRLEVNNFGYEPVHRTILGIHISNERNMLVAENFIGYLVDKYGKHTVYRWRYMISSSLYIFAFET